MNTHGTTSEEFIIPGLQPVQYFSEFFRHAQMGTRTLFLIEDTGDISSTVHHGIATLLSGLKDSELRTMLPEVFGRGLDGQSLSGLQIFSHNNPRGLFQDIIQRTITCNISGSNGANYEDVVLTIGAEFRAVTVESGNPNIGSPTFGLDCEHLTYLENWLMRQREKEGGKVDCSGVHEEMARLRKGQLAFKIDYLKSLFSIQHMSNNGRILIKASAQPGKDTQISVVKSADELETYGTDGWLFFFADQSRVFNKLLPSGIKIGKPLR